MDRKLELLCLNRKVHRILGIDDNWSIAYPNVAIFRRNREELSETLVDDELLEWIA